MGGLRVEPHIGPFCQTNRAKVYHTRAPARGLISVRMGHYAGLCQMTRVALLCCAGGNVILHISTMRRCDARGCQKMGRHIIVANWLFVWRGTRKLRSAVS